MSLKRAELVAPVEVPKTTGPGKPTGEFEVVEAMFNKFKN